MKSLHFVASPRAFGAFAFKLLPTVAAAVAGASCVGTAHAQAPIPVTVSVSSVPRQTLKALGASEPLGNATVLNDPGNKVRDQLMDLTFGDLKMTAVRLWLNIGPRKTTSGSINDPMDATHMEASVKQFTDTYVTSGYIDALKSRGVTTFLLGPSYPTYQASLPPDAYAKRVAAFIKRMRDGATDGNPNTPGVQITMTGLINEPKGGIWSPAMILLGVQTLRAELHRLGLDDVAIIGPETSNSDPGAAKVIQALKSDADTWNRLSGIATHSYGMAANDEVARLVTAPNGAPTKDWWITEAGKLNAYGNDDVGSYEAPTSTSPLGTRAKDTTGKQGASLFAARFLNDMNHGVTHWMWFVAYGVKPLSNENNLPVQGHDKDGGQKLVHPTFDAQSNANGVLMRPKYWYFKQLRDVFPNGTVFRRAESSLDQDMLYSFNKRTHVSVAAGKTPDGSWRIGVLNLTPVATDPTKIPHSISYPAAPYAVTLKINDLNISGPVQFSIARSQPNGDSAALPAQTVTAVNGQITLTVQPQELVTLSSGPAIGILP